MSVTDYLLAQIQGDLIITPLWLGKGNIVINSEQVGFSEEI